MYIHNKKYIKLVDSLVKLIFRINWAKLLFILGRGGGLVDNVLAFYSNDPCLNPAGYLNFLNRKSGHGWNAAFYGAF